MSKNFIASLFNVAASVASMLLLLPIINGSLGLEAYGYAAVALSFINIATIVSVAVTSMASRYIAIPLNQGERGTAQVYFNTVAVACCCLGIVQFLIFVVLSQNVNCVMNVSKDLQNQVSLLLIILSGSFFCTLVKTPCVSGLYFSNKLYINYLFMGASHLARIVAPLLLFPLVGAYLWIPYAGALVLDLFSTVYFFTTYSKHMPELSLSPRHFSWSSLRDLITNGVWISVTKAGAVLLSTISLYLTNLFLSGYESGIFATITQLQSFLAVFTTAVVSVFVPGLYKAFAEGEETLSAEFRRGHISVSIILGGCFGLVCALAIPFMSVWTNEDISPYVVVIFVMMFYPILTYPTEYINQLFITKKYVKMPALATIAFGVFNLALTLLFSLVLKWGMLGIALAQALSVILRNYFVYIPMASRLLGKKFSLFSIYKLELQALLVGCCTFLESMMLCHLTLPNNWPSLIITGLVSLLIAGVFVLLFFPSKERKKLLNFLRKKGKRL